MNNLLCFVCHRQLSGTAPLREHLASKSHIKKVEFWKTVLCQETEKKSVLLTDILKFIKADEPLNLNPLGLGEGITLNHFQKAPCTNSLTKPASDKLSDQRDNVNTLHQQTRPANTTMNNFAVVSQRGPNGEAYIMNGSKGHCYVCNIEMTSQQHCRQHIEGRSHMKKESAAFSSNVVLRSEHPANPVLPNSHNENILRSFSNRGPNGEEYDKIGPGGRCFVCGVEFTSVQLAKEHLAGQKHKKKAALNPRQTTGRTALDMVGPGQSIAHTSTGDYVPTVSVNCGQTANSLSSQNVLGSSVPQAVNCASNMRVDGFLQQGASGVTMCSICNTPFSGRDNAFEHFNSTKHKKREEQLRAVNFTMHENTQGSHDPEQTEVMKVYSPSVHNFVVSNSQVNTSSVDPTDNITRILQVEKQSYSTTSALFQSPLTGTSDKGASASSSSPTNDGILGKQTHVSDSASGQSHFVISETASATGIEQQQSHASSSGSMSKEVADVTSRLKLDHQNNFVTGTTVTKDIHEIDNLSHLMDEHCKLGTKKIDVADSCRAGETSYSSLLDNSMQPSEEIVINVKNVADDGKIQRHSLQPEHDNPGADHSKSIHEEQKNLQEYQRRSDTSNLGTALGEHGGLQQLPLSSPSHSAEVDQRAERSAAYQFDGFRGYCHCCAVELTSVQHANQHLYGQKHRKKLSQWELAQALQRTQAPPQGATQAPLPVRNPQESVLVENNYYFNGSRGFCHVCNIELTSFQHTQQHINGKPHKRNQDRVLMSKKGVTYPLICDICNKSFTGQESALQHFTSSRHKSRADVMNNAVPVLMQIDDGRAIMKDGQMWYFCDVCQVPLNTLEQFHIHKASSRHKKEFESRRCNDTPVKDVATSRASSTEPADGGNVKPFEHPRTSSEEVKQNSTEADQDASYRQKDHLQINQVAEHNPDESIKEKVLDKNRQYLIYGQTPVVNSDIPVPAAQQLNMTLPQADVSVNPNQTSSGLRSYSYVSLGRPILGAGAILAQTAKHGIQQGSRYISDRKESNEQNDEEVPSSQEHFNSKSFLSFTQENVNGSQMFSHAWSTMKTRTGQNIGVELQSGSHGQSGFGRSGSAGSGSSSGPDQENCNNETSQFRRSDSKGATNMPEGTDEAGEDGFRPGGSAGGELLNSVTGQMMTKPRLTQARPGSRGGERTRRDILSLDEKAADDDFDDDAGEEENRDNFNIVENEPVIAVSSQETGTFQVKPLRSDKPGFRYYCPFCNKHMNTRESYESHIKGKGHMYMVSTRPAQVRQLGPICKTNTADLVHRICSMVNERLDIIPRAYQIELVEKAMREDCIIYLPTGTGKTLVAILIMGLMLQDNPSRPVLFLVDKVLLVMQQTRYIAAHFDGRKFFRKDDGQGNLVQRELKIKSICGGLTTKTDMPVWKHDIVITTAAYCINMLNNELIRWEDFSLVVLDEVHHCNKGHPYQKLISNYHRVLPEASRAKILGLTASPAGKSTVELTYSMLCNLLNNLGGANITVVEKEESSLKRVQSMAKDLPIYVPMSTKEEDFKRRLLEYFILCYTQLAQMSVGLDSNTPPCSYFLSALRNPGSREVAIQLADNFVKDPEPLSEILTVIYNAPYKTELSTEQQDCFHQLRIHIVELLLIVPEVGSSVDTTELVRALSSPVVEEFTRMGLPCKQILQRVINFAEDGNNDLSMFCKLVQTLQDPEYISWQDESSRALVLVRERKLAKQYSNRLKAHPVVLKKGLRVGHLVGHGKGAKDGGMDWKKQKKVFDNHEKYHILVGTSIMEEGIDIQALQLVICMNPPTSARALVQMRGRARKKGSHFVVLCSTQEDVEKFQNLQKQELNMQEAARLCVEERRKKNVAAENMS